MTTRAASRMLLGALVALAAACNGSHEHSDAPGVQDDAPPPTGMFGAPCSMNAECIDGYCVQAAGGVGGECTRTCNNDCPPDWTCRDVHVGDSTIQLCIPNAPQLCLECSADTECGQGAACLQIDGSGRCATSCTTSCPMGYTCAVDASGAHPDSYCQPIAGSCTCNDAMAGGTRACTNANTIGTCFGTQTCDPTKGWSACNAPAATLETCNGKDDDCDFLIDEDVGGGQACNITNSYGTCVGVRECAGSAGFSCQGQTPMPELCNYVDDNCNGLIDETFPNLGTVCTPGVGACQRFGSMKCSADGLSTVCSVAAGSPTPELCNGIDDDCDGTVDEGFTGLGGLCSAGLGVCTRYGTTICAAGGMSTTCSATPGTNMSPEICNYLDDNCDGIVDNGFLNPVTGLYDTTANCGACGNNCTTVFTGANSTGACSTSGGTAHCVMTCTAGYFDLDASSVDGCEFALDSTVIYVSVSDPAAADDATCGLGPSGTVAGYHPCKSISYGITRASSTGRGNIKVANGTYNESVTLVTGKNLYGGYNDGTWQRDVATTATVVQGVSSTGNHDRTVIAASVTNATFDGFVVRGSFNTKAGGNSYAFYVSGADSTLVISNNQIFAGRGGPGSDGGPGTNGATGPDGTGSVSGSYDGYTTNSSPCNVSRQFANGASFTCGGNNVSGGNGGGNQCPPASNYTQFSGINGFAGMAGAGAGGGAAGGTSQGGYDGTLQVQGPNQTCFLPVPPMTGADGMPGSNGGVGAGVAGCASAAGTVAGGHWMNGSAAMGLAGYNGGGGGGGAAGGGGACNGVGTCKKDRLGAHGGGGGAGGCAGSGGAPGGGGGGVFGIFVVGGTAPTLSTNTIQRGSGGSAGAGGIGGAGGLGGHGGIGGAEVELCAAKAGRGGDGGAGGSGSGGGGGCGGSSYGIFTSGVGATSYCTTNTVSGGSAGPGGAGGFSGGNSGGNGVAGVLNDCTSI
jgi:hypothetical protein